MRAFVTAALVMVSAAVARIFTCLVSPKGITAWTSATPILMCRFAPNIAAAPYIFRGEGREPERNVGQG